MELRLETAILNIIFILQIDLLLNGEHLKQQH